MSLHSCPFRSRLLAALLLLPPLGAGAQAPAAPAAQAARHRASELSALTSHLAAAEESLRFVESQYVQRPDLTESESQLKRFSDGEIQYLLGDYRTASVLFYDLVSDPTFQQNGRYADALFYLADSLYQQDNLIGSRIYLRDLLEQDTPRYREALARYLETSARLGQLKDVDTYVERARKLSPDGVLPPELAYVFGKATLGRTDLPADVRVPRARAIFTPIAAATSNPLHVLAAYFLGVTHVQAGELEQAAAQFAQVGRLQARGAREREVIQLAHLSQGRVLYEMGRYPEAIDRYQEVETDSPYYAEALYETAWARVRLGEFEKARNATDLLLLVAPESPLAPDARILQGNLLLKLKKYEQATETYNTVINDYAPVRDELDALLSVNKDPVAYFDNLLARNSRNLDVNQLLPAVAVRYATTQQEVADGLRMVNDIEAGRTGVAEAQETAARILTALDERGLEVFPELQEGYQRADAVDTALTNAEQVLVRLEGEALESTLTPEERTQREELRRTREALQQRVASLPRTQQEVEERRKKLQARLDDVDKEAFKLVYELQSLNAVAAAVDKWVADTRPQRQGDGEDEKQLLAQLQEQVEALSSMEQALKQLRGQLADERGRAGASVGGEEELKRQLSEALAREHQLLSAAAARLGTGVEPVLEQAGALRTRLAELRTRVATAKSVMRGKVEKRGERIRAKVAREVDLVRAYTEEVAAVGQDARNLVGRIAFDSFRRVRQQFYELVLKADVGVVDVAFTRKMDHTAEIQRLAAQKDRELRALDAEFSEVLKDEEE